ncbi:hypothetical protein [Streptomyces sp. NPDC054940]
MSDLAAVDLGADGWMLACCGSDGVTLWDPRRMGEPGDEPRWLVDTGASALVVIPGEPQLIVIADAKAVRVIDPASGQEVFGFPQPPHPKGHIGDQVHRLAGVRLDNGTSGFAAARYGGALEVWEPVGGVWRRRRSPFGSFRSGVLTAFDSRLAIATRRGVEVWDLKTGERTARASWTPLSGHSHRFGSVGGRCSPRRFASTTSVGCNSGIRRNRPLSARCSTSTGRRSVFRRTAARRSTPSPASPARTGRPGWPRRQRRLRGHLGAARRARPGRRAASRSDTTAAQWRQLRQGARERRRDRRTATAG